MASMPWTMPLLALRSATLTVAPFTVSDPVLVSSVRSAPLTVVMLLIVARLQSQ